jgi:hypothetical protein
MSANDLPAEFVSWNFPPGVKPGCLPRVTEFGKCQGIPPLRDAVTIIPESDWGDLIGQVSVKPLVRTVLDQDGVGSCATESTTGGVMACRAYHGLEHVLLNPWSIYWKTSGGRDNGSSIDDNLAYVLENGICPESVWPRSKGWRAEPSDEAKQAALGYRALEVFDIETRAEFGSALLTDFAVVFGRAGHSILAVEMTSRTQFTALGSWGTDGAGGTVDGYHLGERLTSVNFGYGAFALRAVTLTDT